MIWLSRLAFLVAFYFVALAFMVAYAMPVLFVTAFILGITNETFRMVQGIACGAAGIATAFVVMRKSWPRAKTATNDDPVNTPVTVQDAASKSN